MDGSQPSFQFGYTWALAQRCSLRHGREPSREIRSAEAMLYQELTQGNARAMCFGHKNSHVTQFASLDRLILHGSRGLLALLLVHSDHEHCRSCPMDALCVLLYQDNHLNASTSKVASASRLDVIAASASFVKGSTLCYKRSPVSAPVRHGCPYGGTREPDF